MRKIIYFTVLFFVCANVRAQVTRFKGTYGGVALEHGYSAVQAYDMGYVAVGATSSYSLSMDIYLFKTDSTGKMQWYKNIGGSNVDIGRSIVETQDTGYVIAGYTNSVATGYDVYVVKTNRYGDTLWTKKYGGTGWDFAYSIYETYDSGFVIAGGTYSFGAGNEDFYLLKLDKNGDTLWTKTYGGTNDDVAMCVIESSQDSGFVLAGKSKSYNDINGSAYLIKTDKNGLLQWAKEYGGGSEDCINSVVETKIFKGYVAVGATSSYSSNEDVYVMRTNYIGDTLWTRAYQPNLLPHADDVAHSVAVSLADSCFAFLGYTESSSPGFEDVYFFKFDSAGDYRSSTTYGTVHHDIGYSIFPTHDNGFIVCGQTDTTATGFGQPNVFLIKTDSLGFTQTAPFVNSINKSVSLSKYTVKVYPNPVDRYTTITIVGNQFDKNGALVFKVYDVSGKLVLSQTSNIASEYFSESNTQLNIETLHSGFYFLEICIGQERIACGKLIKK